MAGAGYNTRGLLNGVGAVALRRSIPKHPDKPLSYLPVLLNVILRMAALVLLVDVATQTRGILQVGVILVDLLILAPLAALYAIGLFLVINMRNSILEEMRQAKEDLGLPQ
jgi:hypothetical protein